VAEPGRGREENYVRALLLLFLGLARRTPEFALRSAATATPVMARLENIADARPACCANTPNVQSHLDIPERPWSTTLMKAARSITTALTLTERNTELSPCGIAGPMGAILARALYVARRANIAPHRAQHHPEVPPVVGVDD